MKPAHELHRAFGLIFYRSREKFKDKWRRWYLEGLGIVSYDMERFTSKGGSEATITQEVKKMNVFKTARLVVFISVGLGLSLAGWVDYMIITKCSLRAGITLIFFEIWVPILLWALRIYLDPYRRGSQPQ